MKAIVVVENWTNCEYNYDMYGNSQSVLGVVSNTAIARKLIDSRIEELTLEARKEEPTVEVERVDIEGHLPVLHIRYKENPNKFNVTDEEQYSYVIESHDLIDEL